MSVQEPIGMLWPLKILGWYSEPHQLDGSLLQKGAQKHQTSQKISSH